VGGGGIHERFSDKSIFKQTKKIEKRQQQTVNRKGLIHVVIRCEERIRAIPFIQLVTTALSEKHIEYFSRIF